MLLSLVASEALKGKLATLGAPRPLTAPPSTSTAPLGREGDAFSAVAESLVKKTAIRPTDLPEEAFPGALDASARTSSGT